MIRKSEIVSSSRLEPFSPGQVYNASKAQQVHVLPAAPSEANWMQILVLKMYNTSMALLSANCMYIYQVSFYVIWYISMILNNIIINLLFITILSLFMFLYFLIEIWVLDKQNLYILFEIICLYNVCSKIKF